MVLFSKGPKNILKEWKKKKNLFSIEKWNPESYLVCNACLELASDSSFPSKILNEIAAVAFTYFNGVLRVGISILSNFGEKVFT